MPPIPPNPTAQQLKDITMDRIDDFAAAAVLDALATQRLKKLFPDSSFDVETEVQRLRAGTGAITGREELRAAQVYQSMEDETQIMAAALRAEALQAHKNVGDPAINDTADKVLDALVVVSSGGFVAMRDAFAARAGDFAKARQTALGPTP